MVKRDPAVEVLEVSDDRIKFVLSKTDTSMANALRRVMLAEVPTITIDLVDFEDNTSVLQDEYIAHRLGMIPLSSQGAADMKYKWECECTDGCHLCTVKFTLDVKNDGEEVRNVTSYDLRTDEENVQPIHESCKPPDLQEGEGILIVKLKAGQRLKFSAFAYKGQGKMHMKWSPSCTTTYQMDPDITIDYGKMEGWTDREKADFVKSCPAKVFTMENNSGIVDIEDASRCMYCDECKKTGAAILRTRHAANKYPDVPVSLLLSTPVADVRPKEGRFIFTTESNGSLPAKDIVKQALHCLKTKLSVTSQEVNKVVDGEEDKQFY
mmetsp:Transcript_36355/g.94548  ORF Transcript_36355/g.94548 Transcript_36355/m.94548 type:complete len:323 (-) Transcript_36355:191-1159(-)|eukprot:CAMPEP_0113883858 /NCGR_PEP_ID=MMETSP0780_2-20120614/9864_1 /TAXON_ID=652834 /ORGANISM="Palpitomonas bilix" /LENGTH=322 /DNA_ID=CAMNT_0000871271 /DNA_START=220 /DNA_END=1188 /DNA_ORIENTATION=+ /assembly_acc=CAM_ASM_000599